MGQNQASKADFGRERGRVVSSHSSVGEKKEKK